MYRANGTTNSLHRFDEASSAPLESGDATLASSAEMAARILPGLDLLLRSYDYAQDLECDVWDFAVEMRELGAAELTSSDLRWLVRKGYAEHAREITLAGEESR